jgi:hypothetical protein
MSCGISVVARKLQTTEVSGVDAAIAAITLRMATKHLAGTRVPPRARRIQIPTVRRRLPIKTFPEIAQPVKIGHSPQESDTAFSLKTADGMNREPLEILETKA